MPEPAIPQVVPVVEMKTLTLPLDRYAPDTAQYSLVEHARVVLIIECLRGFGIDHEIPPPSPPGPSGKYAERYGIADAAQARTHGYHPAPQDTEAAGQAGDFSLKPEARAIATGQVATAAGRKVPAGGCTGEADRKLLEGVKYDLPELFYEKLFSEAFDRARNDSRVRSAYAVWSACMTKSGFKYPDPWAANNDPRWLESEVASKDEIATATADVTCKQESNLVNIFAAVERAYHEQVIERNPAPFAKLEARLQAQVRNAQAVTAA
ncbi:hypothetical protein [Actinoplanes italicus]|nr:hypothetical protein [Actinoplanes italicus]